MWLSTFDGIDVDKYLRNNDGGVQEYDTAQRELERTALQSLHHLLASSVQLNTMFWQLKAQLGLLKAKLHYASWFGAGSKMVRAEIWPII